MRGSWAGVVWLLLSGLLLAAAVLFIGICMTFYVQRPSIGAVVPATDHILIEKAAHRMTLFKRGKIIRAYRVALGRGGLANKERAGDNRVPEGGYRIVAHNPASAYHLSLRLSYPDAAQIALARKRGLDPGGDIMIHGVRNGLGWIGAWHRNFDWTKGCVGLTDEEIEEVWRLVPDGTEVEIRG